MAVSSGRHYIQLFPDQAEMRTPSSNIERALMGMNPTTLPPNVRLVAKHQRIRAVHP
jgi:hypothetical protein